MFDAAAVQAVLFDLDGTLIESDDQAVERLAAWFQRMHIPDPHRKARWLVTKAETPLNHLLTVLDIIGMDGLLFALPRLFRGHHRTAPDFRLVAGVPEMLRQLRPRFRLGIVSTRPKDDVLALLRQHHLGELFDVLVTRETTWRLKPHPAPIRHAARALGIHPQACLMVGDTPVDIRAARRAGAWAVGVLSGFGERAELERAGAHAVLEDTTRLSALLMPQISKGANPTGTDHSAGAPSGDPA